MRDKRMQCRNIVAAAACLGFLAAGARGDFDPADPFTLANIETGSTRFTNTNEVEVAQFPIPDGYNRYQITEEGDVSAVTGSWTPTNTPPPPQGFSEPANDTNITLYAWFTNETASVTLRRAEGEIAYTTVAPAPALHAALARETAGFTVRVAGRDLDAGSTGGEFDGEALDIYSLEAQYVSGTYPDGTPGQTYVTLTNRTSTYQLGLRVVNEAGTAATAGSNCTVTVSVTEDLPAGNRYVAVGNLLAAAPYDNWTNAAATIQDGIDEALADDLVLVAPGIYTLPPSPSTYDNVSNVVQLTQALTLRGASGNPDDTIIDGEDQYRGVYISPPEHTQAVIDGFTIRNGRATAGNGRGGGVVMRNLNNRTIFLQNSIVESNTAGDAGGGVYIGNSTAGSFTAILSNTVVRLNQAPGGQRGGGIGTEMQNSTLIIADCVISQNTSIPGSTWEAAGGISLRSNGSQTLIERSVIADNNAGGGRAGAIYMSSSSLTLRNSLLTGNRGSGYGTISVRGSENIVIENSTFADNDDAVYFFKTTSASIQGYNTVLYNDSFSNPGGAGSIDFEHSCRYPTEALLPGVNNINDDPEFVDPDANDYRLTQTSPCVNTGTNQAWMANALDLDGRPRIDKQVGTVDRGCYEYQYLGTLITIQ